MERGRERAKNCVSEKGIGTIKRYSRIPIQSAMLHLHLSTSTKSRKNVCNIFNSIESSEFPHIDQICLKMPEIDLVTEHKQHFLE